MLSDWTNQFEMVNQMYDELRTGPWDEVDSDALRRKYGLDYESEVFREFFAHEFLLIKCNFILGKIVTS